MMNNNVVLPPPPSLPSMLPGVTVDNASSSASKTDESPRQRDSEGSSNASTPRQQGHGFRRGTGTRQSEGDTEEAARAQDEQVDEMLHTLFQEYEEDGFIDGVNMMDILHECGLECTDQQLREMLGDQFNEIDLELAQDVLLQLRVTAKKSAAHAKNALASEVRTAMTISIFRYLQLVLTCSKDPNIEYTVKGPEFVIQPKELLIVSIGLIMLLTGGLLILIIALLWLEAAQTAEETSVSRFGTALGSFITSYDFVFTDKIGSELMDMASEFAFFEDLRFLKIIDRDKAHIQRTAQMLAARVDYDTSVHLLNDARLVAGYLGSLHMAVKFMAPAAAHKVTLQRLSAMTTGNRFKNTWYSYAINATDNTILHNSDPRPCPNGVCLTQIPCLQVTDRNKPVDFPQTIDVTGTGAVAVGLNMGTVNMKVCVAFPRSKVHDIAIEVAQKDVEPAKVLADLFNVDEVLAVKPKDGSTHTQPKLQFVTDLTIAPQRCYFEGDCHHSDRLIAASLFNRTATGDAGTKDRAGELSAVAAAPTENELAIALTKKRDHLLNREFGLLKELFRFLNQKRIFELGTTIEVVLILRNETLNNAMYQASPYAFVADCLGECQRSPFSLENAKAGYDTKGKGYSITPDYRPEAVMGGYGYSREDAVGVVLLVERDVMEIRGLAMSSLTDMITTNNAQFFGTFEIQLVHNEGQKLTRTYDPRDSCPSGVACTSTPDHGIIYRNDCRHCTRQEEINSVHLVHLTQPKLIDQCSDCSPERLRNTKNLGHNALVARSVEGRYVTDQIDYRNEKVLAFYGYNLNFSVAYYLKVDTNEVMDPIMEKIYTSLGSSVGMVLFALVVLMLMSRNLIAKIESEWLNYKDHIVEQRKEFGDLVREVLPAHIAEQAMAEKFCYAEAANIVTMFTEATDLSLRLTKLNWSIEAFVRYTTYVYNLMDVVGEHYRLYRVRNIGDMTLFVCGLAETFDDKDKKEGHPVMRMLTAATCLQQISSQRYAHFPHKTDLYSDTFGPGTFDFPEKQATDSPQANAGLPNGSTSKPTESPRQPGTPNSALGLGFNKDQTMEKTGHIRMPKFRMGVHFAATTVHVIQVGKTPHFDAIGASSALAHRMMTTSRGGCIHVSDTVKDTCDKLDSTKVFQYGKGKSIIVRGRGSVTGFVIESADTTLPQTILSKLNIRFAKRNVVFTEDAKERPDGSIFSGMTATTTSTSTSNSSY